MKEPRKVTEPATDRPQLHVSHRASHVSCQACTCSIAPSPDIIPQFHLAMRTYRVIVNLDVRHQAAREVIAGVLRFAAKHPEWDVQMRGNHPSNDGFMLDPNWTPDGLIIDDAWQTRDGGPLGRRRRQADRRIRTSSRKELQRSDRTFHLPRDPERPAGKGQGALEKDLPANRRDRRALRLRKRQLPQEPLPEALRTNDERLPIRKQVSTKTHRQSSRPSPATQAGKRKSPARRESICTSLSRGSAKELSRRTAVGIQI